MHSFLCIVYRLLLPEVATVPVWMWCPVWLSSMLQWMTSVVLQMLRVVMSWCWAARWHSLAPKSSVRTKMRTVSVVMVPAVVLGPKGLSPEGGRSVAPHSHSSCAFDCRAQLPGLGTLLRVDHRRLHLRRCRAKPVDLRPVGLR